ncbi:ABC-F family ATP-binding cassette domain-containing protein [Candidatus Dojkabacteria bacterium]|nr:ABC-F family ATP-binding cassette domain-containing protein [Candidatus Dojkabacteria bacterium]
MSDFEKSVSISKLLKLSQIYLVYMLALDEITFAYSNEGLLDKVSGSIGPGQKVGLIGVNGAGKSTLLKIIVGEIEPDSGKIRNSFVTGYMPQEIGDDCCASGSVSIRDFINDEGEAHHEDYKISELLAKIGMSDKLPGSSFSKLSGGQKTKVAIVKLLLDEPDMLILDEPTNFLDINAANWLMKYLGKYKGGVLVVSHDIRLMDQSIDKVWFLNEFTHKIDQYKGNYSKFLAQKELEDDQVIKRIKKEENEYKKLLIKAKNLGQVKKYKHTAAKIREKAVVMKESFDHRILKSKKMRVPFQIREKPGHKILEVSNVSKSFLTETGIKQVLCDINFTLIRKQRMVVIGVNGVGKTTLLKMIAGKLEPDNGPGGKAEIKLGYNVELGYYAQEYENLDYSRTPLDELKGMERGREDRGKIRSYLGNFLFTKEQVFQRISTLSGGERTRLALAKLFYSGHNLLLLDEPTTFLDPQSQDILIETISGYPESLIVVSHNPGLVAGIKPTHALLLPEEKIVYYEDSLLERVTIY